MIKIKLASKDRQKMILQKLVKSYIQKGKPIASQFLIFHCNFDVSPATIRNDFQELDEEGYLYKFHISSGRIPTDKAWKYFVQMMIEEDGLIEHWKERWKIVLAHKIKHINDWDKVINFVSEQSRALSFCYLPGEDEIKKYGLKYIFSDLLEDPYLIPEVADSLDNLDTQIKQLKMKEDRLILIGHDNPFINSDEFSVILCKSRRSDSIFGILGNKRMPYDKNIGLLSALAEI